MTLTAVYAGGQLKVSWPVSSGKGRLKSAPFLGSDTAWVPVETDIIERQGVFECVFPVDSSPQLQRFYQWSP
jgi:hypothetical protein